MTGRLTDKVAFITGTARGQGRAHAVRMATEGADIIAIDLAGKLPSCVPYDSATSVELDGLRSAVDDGVATLGRLDIIVANAGISAPSACNEITPEAFRDVMDVNVMGTWNTVMAGAQKIIDGGRGQQQSDTDGHADAVSAELGGSTRRHRRRGVLVGQ